MPSTATSSEEMTFGSTSVTARPMVLTSSPMRDSRSPLPAFSITAVGSANARCTTRSRSVASTVSPRLLVR
jgi:hypothetical protein